MTAVEGRQDPGSQRWRAPAVNQLEHCMQVKPAVAGQLFSEPHFESCALQLPETPRNNPSQRRIGQVWM
jgi:hypothetical protein